MSRFLFGRRYTFTALVMAGLILVSGCNTESPGETADLKDTQWTLVSYADAQGEMVAPLPGTEITAEFTAEEIAGRAGCNHYFGSYDINGAELTLGPVAATEMWCAEPEGTMAQEQAYLVALQATAGYRVEGETLTLLDADGAPLATFSPAG